MFGYTLIKKDRLRILEQNSRAMDRLVQVVDWFSGWEDLRIIWKYIFMPDGMHIGGISRCREDYAKERGTNEYGKPKEKP